MNTLVQKVISTALQHRQGRKVRILEIGAGTGGTTSHILPYLCDDTEYVFTDVSPLFVSKAEKKYTNYPNINCQILDIEQEPSTQGFSFHEYDLVIAANVLHATQNLKQSTMCSSY
ncbi:class I SAM-dependent methyltransferase [Nostoc sp. CCY 9925]|uniref:class I SAM-dependent methyltransferase n=1 Tax=Nostoc sp. CCY 9925 TaxID=3103865 RepID=UPI0039C73A52